MADTRLLEQTGETYIVHELCRHKFLVLKPFFDHNGVDLIILSEASPSAKIGVIQAKYRSVTDERGSNISIPCRYLHDRFIAFLYVEDSMSDRLLYLFFPEDIRMWSESQGSYILSIPKSQQLSSFQVDRIFSHEDAFRIREIVENSDSALSLDALILGQNALLNSIFQNWRIHGIRPSAQELVAVDEDEDLLLDATPEQLAWAFAHSYLVADDLKYHTFEYCFRELANLHNFDQPLVSAERVGSVTQFFSGIGAWHVVYPKYIIAEMVMIMEDGPPRGISGLYAMVRDSEGEGIEFFIPQDREEKLLIRHISNGARQYALHTADMLSSKS